MQKCEVKKPNSHTHTDKQTNFGAQANERTHCRAQCAQRLRRSAKHLICMAYFDMHNTLILHITIYMYSENE